VDAVLGIIRLLGAAIAVSRAVENFRLGNEAARRYLGALEMDLDPRNGFGSVLEASLGSQQHEAEDEGSHGDGSLAWMQFSCL
jgi:hypothetical protein